MANVRNGVCQWDQIGRRRLKKKKSGTRQHFCPQSKLQLIPAPLALPIKLVNESPLYMAQALFTLIPLHWDLGHVSLCACPLRAKSHFPTDLQLTWTEPCWFSKPDIIGAHHPSAGPQGLDTQRGAQTPLSLGRASAVVISSPTCGSLPQGCGS